MKVEMLLSRMDGQARWKPSWTAIFKVSPLFNSSFIRSNISTLASTAIPVDITKPAMPGRVNVMGISLKIANKIAAYIPRATVATRPGETVINNHKKCHTGNTDQARRVRLLCRESAPRVASTSVCCMIFKGTLKVPEFSSMARVFAWSSVTP